MVLIFIYCIFILFYFTIFFFWYLLSRIMTILSPSSAAPLPLQQGSNSFKCHGSVRLPT
ncbi:hypothetical protein BDV38DRAFT_260472 [Aspergillus pseudotamarii]|uniref:Uncharacterized protein n=1 Tax=Aspergillus pseudotamarii TaxID=132259 RepID=A0A5N6SG41_ASPPS|nr:uncharacterized protein BDV38DRAFT_260472 [Aspergillus pseudotamarii]KAE8132680.1 hypothetical protein BDV38DRAFT_260472 [Aspergillus pseudotamarii]